MAAKKETKTNNIVETEAVTQPLNNTKKEAFLKALADVSSMKNVGQIALLTDMREENVAKTSSGSIVLDSILGGGIPKGRIIEIYGPEGSGKTSIALTALGNVQKEGGTGVFLDVEQAFDPNYAKALGVKIDELGFSQPSVAEEVLTMILKLIETGTVDIIVLDSVAAMTPKAELEADLEKASMATLARVMSKAMKRIAQKANEFNCTVIFINQIRDNVGDMWGPKTSTPGGKALKFTASQRIEVKKVRLVTEGDNTIGTEVRLKCIKNKVAAPYGEGLTVLTFAKGINRAAECMVVGEDLGVLIKNGRTYTFETLDNIDVSGYNSTVEQEGDPENGVPTIIKIATSKAGLLEELEKNEKLLSAINKQIEEVIKSNIINGKNAE